MNIEILKSLSVEERQKKYFNYLLFTAIKQGGGHYHPRTAKRYAYDGPNNKTTKNIIKLISNKDSLFEILDVEVLNKIKETIKSNDYDINGNKMYSNSISSYIDFINDKTKTIYNEKEPESMIKFITAIKTKPFILLAGISGTGKSRIVRQLARACDNIDENPWDIQKPINFEMIQVKPNWHDSGELLGYVSQINGEKFIVGDLLKFIVEAWKNPFTPFFLCLDEMNLAPVEQYFAEYLSIIETRKLINTNIITTDPILKPSCQKWYNDLICEFAKNDKVLKEQFLSNGITIPQNLIVMGTVNMDETTFAFSRKVLDRAMTIEMNEVNMKIGLKKEDLQHEQFKLSYDDIISKYVEGKDVYENNSSLCDTIIKYLEMINDVLDGTPFKIAYRTRNEFLIYAVNRGEENINYAIDEMTSMKILSRIEGDEDKLKNKDNIPVLDAIEKVLKENIGNTKSISLNKISEMKKRLANMGYTSYWS